MPSFQRHVFVCVNQRPEGHPRGCCKEKGGEAVRTAFKRQVTARGLKSLVRANKAGCLDQCENGVTVVVYPEQVWYGGVTVDDVTEIMDRHIVGGEFVTRLMMGEQAHLAGAARAPALGVGEGDAGEGDIREAPAPAEPAPVVGADPTDPDRRPES